MRRPGSERAKERKFQGVNWPGSEKAVNRGMSVTLITGDIRNLGNEGNSYGISRSDCRTCSFT